MKYVMKQMKELISTKGLNVDMVYLNCKSSSTLTSVFRDITDEVLSEEVPNSGVGYDHYLKRLNNYLEGNNRKLVVVLDEVDFIGSDSAESHLSTVLYNLTDNDSITTIMVSNDFEWKDDIEEPRVNSRMGSQKLRFDEYTEEQLFNILRDRAEMGLVEDAWTDETIKKISEHAAEKYGDARNGLRLLKYSAQAAKNDYKDRIENKHIQEGLAMVRRHKVMDGVLGLGKQKKVLLKALAERMKAPNPPTTSQLYKEYKKQSEKESVDTMSKNMIYSYLEDFEMMGIVERNKSYKGGSRGQSEMRIIPSFEASKYLKNWNQIKSVNTGYLSN